MSSPWVYKLEWVSVDEGLGLDPVLWAGVEEGVSSQ